MSPLDLIWDTVAHVHILRQLTYKRLIKLILSYAHGLGSSYYYRKLYTNYYYCLSIAASTVNPINIIISDLMSHGGRYSPPYPPVSNDFIYLIVFFVVLACGTILSWHFGTVYGGRSRIHLRIRPGTPLTRLWILELGTRDHIVVTGRDWKGVDRHPPWQGQQDMKGNR